jgi:hypothetical protein
MYIGSTSHRGLHHLVYEVVDNSIDEALAGYATRSGHDPRRRLDHRRGRRPRHSRRHAPDGEAAGLELAMTVLHAGGKFDKNTYKVSGGLHGVGVSVVNALSEQLKVWVKRDGKEHYMDFVRGDTTTKLKVLGTVPAKETGTKVWFKPDAQIFTELRVRLRHARHAPARAVVPQQGRDDHAHRRARGRGEAETFHAEGRPQGVRSAPQREPQAAAPGGRLHRGESATTSPSKSRCSTTTATTRTSSRS